jgi:sulfide:quinone oxidoreductase
MMSVTVVGGGIGGLETAIYLRRYGFNVTMISDREYLYLYPTSIWIPVGKKDFDDVCFPLEDFAKVHGFKLIVDPLTKIDSKKRELVLKSQTLSYETLVLAMGAGKMPVNGKEHAPSVCGKPGEAVILKSHIDALIGKGSGVISMGFGGNPKDTSAVRGGPAFELIFNVHNKLKRLGIRDKFELNFFAPMERPGQKMGDKAVERMAKIFDQQNIGMHFGKKIKQFSSEGVIFADDSILKSDVMMFIAAGAGNPLLAESGLPVSEAGFITITKECQVEGFSDIYAVGDIASIEGAEWRAKQGHLAEAMGRAVAFNLKNIRDGKSERETYAAHMNIICLMDNGKNAALVYRSAKKEMMVPLPFCGHFFKKAWGWYYKNSKLKRFPRIPGM